MTTMRKSVRPPECWPGTCDENTEGAQLVRFDRNVGAAAHHLFHAGDGHGGTRRAVNRRLMVRGSGIMLRIFMV